MLELMTFRPEQNEPSSSPFCTKAMICLTLAGQTWQPDFDPDFGAIPIGKLPVLKAGDALIPDSNRIIAWLEAQGADLFPGLDARGRAQAHAIMRMVEENLRLGLVHDRWIDEDVWPIVKDRFFGIVPEAARDEVADGIREQIQGWLNGHGVTRCSKADRMTYFAPDLAALTALLEGQDWLNGDQPGAVDASALPVLSALETLPVETDLCRAIRNNATLMAYLRRGRSTLFQPLLNAVSAAA
ncbi:glutathione S-transferase family protein [Primorskyibacter sp. 2E107]|uniref:glutathione S-transferase family protein n=1 Tax=Primorskyibacter sp. 2E107 TaxID=3403458 RepID=UPI003AF40BC0